MRLAQFRAALGLAPLFHGLRSSPVQFAIALGALALGVALGLAIHLINRAALAEFSVALRSISGGADLTVQGARAGFEPALYARIAQLEAVAVASPMVELDVRLVGRNRTLRVLGIDVFRAVLVQPSLAPVPAGESRDPLAGLRPDAIFLAPPIAAELGLNAGDRLGVQSGLGVRELVVAGSLPADVRRPALAVMDIAAAQDLAGSSEIHRIDIRVRPGFDPTQVAASIQPLLPAGVHVTDAGAAGVAAERLTRAYRVNLTVLALVALFTGALLAFSTQALAIVRRRTELAILRALGLTRAELVARLLAEAAIAGAIGAAVGVVLGYVLAWIASRLLGADLGAGFFRGVQPVIEFAPLATLAFFALGVSAAVLGALVPAIEASRANPAQSLRAGDDERMWSRLRPWWPGLVCFALAGGLIFVPPIADLPLGAYLAIAALLFGTILSMPRLAAFTFHRLPNALAQSNSPALSLAIAQLRGAPGQAAVSLAAIVAAVALAVAMAIMVSSFRDSLDAWLVKLLPADLYLRAGGGADSAYLDRDAQARIVATPGVARAEFLRHLPVALVADRPRVSVLARDLDVNDPGARLPLVRSGGASSGADDAVAVWVSESVAEVYGYGIGARFKLPLGAATPTVRVDGIWRDYGRQQGSIVIERSRYVALTGDTRANDAALWLAPGASLESVRASIDAIGEGIELNTPGAIRSVSLTIFDRTFAVTYGLEAVAILIGLAGLAASAGAIVLARRREFGVLRFLGYTRGDIAQLLAAQGALIACLAAVVGCAAGALISLILVYRVNRQSFHWTMDLSVPWLSLAVFVIALVVAAVITSMASGRAAMGATATGAVKEDW